MSQKFPWFQVLVTALGLTLGNTIVLAITTGIDWRHVVEHAYFQLLALVVYCTIEKYLEESPVPQMTRKARVALTQVWQRFFSMSRVKQDKTKKAGVYNQDGPWPALPSPRIPELVTKKCKYCGKTIKDRWPSSLTYEWWTLDGQDGCPNNPSPVKTLFGPHVPVSQEE